jgi:prevent-host-death family protein
MCYVLHMSATPELRPGAARRIGVRELRQHASLYVDLAEKGYTVDITNRGRLVARLVPVQEPESPLERLFAAGILEPAEDPGDLLDVEPGPPVPPGRPAASEILQQMREEERY